DARAQPGRARRRQAVGLRAAPRPLRHVLRPPRPRQDVPRAPVGAAAGDADAPGAQAGPPGAEPVRDAQGLPARLSDTRAGRRRRRSRAARLRSSAALGHRGPRAGPPIARDGDADAGVRRGQGRAGESAARQRGEIGAERSHRQVEWTGRAGWAGRSGGGEITR
ncbi:hypothetical protein BN1708_018455, partial [Verticillium longisporum]